MPFSHGIRLIAAAGLAAFLCGCEGSGSASVNFGDNDPNVVVAVGDSITVGGYPADVAAITGKRVVNAGDSGTVSAEGIDNAANMLAAHSPGYLLILYGANDVISSESPDVTIANLRTIIRMAKDNHTVPVIGTLTPMFRDHDVYEPGVEALNPMIRGLASSEGCRLADLFKAFDYDESLLGEDGLHPTSAGQYLIATTFADKIQ